MNLSLNNAQLKAMAGSFARVFVAAAFAAYLGLHKGFGSLSTNDFKVVLDAGLSALGLTVVNYFRSGETRFGVNASATVVAADPPTA